MLRFEPSKSANHKRRPPGLLSRGMQLRLVTLIVGLGFVLAAMSHLQRPEGAAALDQFLHGGPRAVEPDKAYLAAPPRVDPTLLATIEDNTPFRSAESPAWFAMLTHVRDAPSETLAETAAGPLTYAQLTRQPQVYRGRPVRLAGALKRVERVAPGENDRGIELLYRMVLQGRGGETWPFTVYALAPPAGVELGETIDLPVETAGLFFKNWSYRYRDGLGISPIVVTAGVTLPTVAAPTEQAANTFAPWQVLAAAGVLAAVVLLVVRAAMPKEAAAAPPATAVDFSQLTDQSPPTDQPDD